MPHTECAHRQAQTQISNDTLKPSPCSAMHSITPMGCWSKCSALHERQGFMWDAAYTDTSSHYRRGSFYYTSQSLSTVWSSVSECQQQHVSSLSVLCPLCPSLQVSIFKVPILKGEPFLLPLAPFLIVKVYVSALEEDTKWKETITLTDGMQPMHNI